MKPCGEFGRVNYTQKRGVTSSRVGTAEATNKQTLVIGAECSLGFAVVPS